MRYELLLRLPSWVAAHRPAYGVLARPRVLPELRARADGRSVEGARAMMNIRIGKISKILFPDYGQCRRCKTTWNLVNPHDVPYREGQAIFRLCEKCWHEVAPADRLSFFADVQDTERWTDVAAAVVNEP